MGKRNVEDDSDQEMEIEPQVVTAPKHKKIKKNTTQRPSTSEKEGQKQKKHTGKSLMSKITKKLARQVNAGPLKHDLSEKQGIFNKIVGEVKRNDKIPKKDRKKQRIIIKKQLRKELDYKQLKEKIQTKPKLESMQEEKNIVRKQKFVQAKAVNHFKQNMGLKFGNLKAILNSKGQ